MKKIASLPLRTQKMDDHNSTVLLIDSQDEKAQTKYNTSDKKPKETYIRGEAIKSIVYADLDAIVTSFSLISSISVGHLSSIDVLVLGFANLVADGISMGFGDYMSSGTEKDMAAKERVLTHWEVSNHGESQELELVRRYQAPGMELDDATIVVKVLSKLQGHTTRACLFTGHGLCQWCYFSFPVSATCVVFVVEAIKMAKSLETEIIGWGYDLLD